MANKTYRDKAGEYIAEHAQYIGNTSPVYAYYVRYKGRSYFGDDTDELADKLAPLMKSEARKLRIVK